MLKKTSEKGFTIVELLIVIVVIGILAALVLNTFAGVQRRARDSTRQTSVNALATQLEAYYSNNGSYPALATSSTNGIANTSWISGNLKGFDSKALIAPQAASGATNSYTATVPAVTSANTYSYVTQPATCNTPTDATASAIAAATPCAGFTISWWGEDKAAVQTKESLNKP